MLDSYKRFDMKKRPNRQHFRPLLRLLSLPSLWSHREKLTKTNMEGVEPPYLFLSNHNSFIDFLVGYKAVAPHKVNFVASIDGFAVFGEKIMRFIGCICKRKFTNDTLLLRKMTRVIKNGDIIGIYPEARYSLCGTTAVLPESLGKLVKLFNVPVVTLMCHGHHINQPFWNQKSRHVKGLTAEMNCLLKKEEVEKLSVDEINQKIKDSFWYDDFKWQKDNNIKVKYKKRAEGLEKVLYQCPHCLKEYHMSSNLDILKCDNCGKQWQMTELGELKALDGETEFSHIPDWYEWERLNIRKEVWENRYSFSSKVIVDAIPNNKFIPIGEAYFEHNMNGFFLKGNFEGEDYSIEIPAKTTYSVHIEYNFKLRKRDCIDLNTLTDTCYVYPDGNEFSVTKMALATEELFQYYKQNQK